MTNTPAPRPGIMRINPYKGGASHIDGIEDIVKLSSNENPNGPSEKAKAAFAQTSGQLHRYPPSDHADFRIAIGHIHGLNPDQIICGAGSDEIITFLCQAYAGPGDEVIHTEHGFSMHRISALASGATPVEAAEKERVVDVDAILSACSDKTRLVFIANPANPTGTMIDPEQTERLASGIPERAILVLDAAYAEYADGFDGGEKLASERKNVFMTRTFSKLYGLGGLRVGWGYGPQDIIDVLNKVRGPFNLSQTQLQTATAAVNDREHATHSAIENARLRSWLARELANIDVPSDDSSANFILARFADQNEADACYDYLNASGLIVRRVTGYKLPNCLRITIGTESACRKVVQSITTFKEINK